MMHPKTRIPIAAALLVLVFGIAGHVRGVRRPVENLEALFRSSNRTAIQLQTLTSKCRNRPRISLAASMIALTPVC